MKRLWILAIACALAGWGCTGERKQNQQENAQTGTEQTSVTQKTEVPPPVETAKPAEVPPELKPAPEKPAESKPAEPKPAESKPAPKPADAGPITKMVTLPTGYEFQVVVDEPVSTETHQAGRAFQARLVKAAVTKVEGQVIPAGSTIRGEVTYSKRAARLGGKAEMTLEFRELRTPDGKVYPLYADPLVLQGESTTSGDVQKVVGGAVGGAIIGGILGGKGGAVKGGAAGGAAGTAWAVATRGNDIVIDPGQVMQVSLNRQLRVPVTIPQGRLVQ